MTEREVWEKCWAENPYLDKNNRGKLKDQHGNYVSYGYPQPPAGRKEGKGDFKGSDYIGPHVITVTPDMVGKKIAIFKGIEIKCLGDRLMEGQKKFHNWLLDIGGLSEIHYEKKDGSIVVVKEKIKGELF